MIRWLWAFIDRPLERFDEAATFWTAATDSALSPRRGEHGQFATMLPQAFADDAESDDAEHDVAEHAAPDAWVKLQGALAGEGGAHLDLDVDDVDAVTHAAIEEHGAALVHREGVDLSVLRTPGGQLFCVTRWDGHARRPRVRVPGVLDQLCLDIASEQLTARSLSGPGSRAGRHSRRDRSSLDWPCPTRCRSTYCNLLLQRRDSAGEPSSAHIDLACGNDVAGVRARHEALGARWVADGRNWQVMRDLAGGLYCLTGRDPSTGRLAA